MSGCNFDHLIGVFKKHSIFYSVGPSHAELEPQVPAMVGNWSLTLICFNEKVDKIMLLVIQCTEAKLTVNLKFN